MLRTVLSALLLGLAVSLGILELVVAPRAQGPGNGGDRILDPAAAAVGTGQASVQDGKLLVQLDDTGNAWFTWSLEGIVAEHYPFIHLSLSQYPQDLAMTLVWGGTESEVPHTYKLETRPREELLIAVREFQEWSGEQVALGLSFNGDPGATVVLSGVALRGPAPLLELRALADDWTGFTPWRRSAVNSHIGVTRVSPLYPAPAVAVLLALSLGACLLIWMLRGRRGPPWSALGLVFLGCWLLLDARWQYELLRQLSETRQQFTGLTMEQKRAEGPDAKLYDFVRRAGDVLDSPDARVFVSSMDDYRGLRAAYYLLPHNTFFELRDRPLPSRFLRTGDYILVLQPSHARVPPGRGFIMTRRGKVPVESLLQEQGNSLLRVR